MSIEKKIFSLLGICMLLTMLVSACRIIDSNNIPQNPKVEMGATNFLKPTITIKKGNSLDLIDSVASQHIIINGKWDGSQQVKTQEPGAPSVNFTVNASGEAHTVGPFNTAGNFNIYCTIHPGMNLTVTVQ
ncbi:cupredoxin domain-containing protein [Tengunoibacter tsumagoiensis]|uniref:Blue (type 1) copper domain-containing protein n=1 Tax=Tengunoibacter tsumagoiensis TaxID=2014871 RepID=A0A402A627_9CHLR|nr:plastocyanin/azurin family copper-binding protein [Tengunoibacter tsumagoiensis]GCE14441.1 hypothetical protein KTT_43000 [Tengunoibacter tsumagoiensis]